MNVSIKTFKSHLVSRTSCPLTILIPRRYGWNEWTLKSHTIFLPLCHKMWVLKKKLQEEEKLAPGPGVTSENHEVLLCLLVSVTHRCCHRCILLRLFGTKAPERPRLREKRRNSGKKTQHGRWNKHADQTGICGWNLLVLDMWSHTTFCSDKCDKTEFAGT